MLGGRCVFTDATCAQFRNGDSGSCAEILERKINDTFECAGGEEIVCDGPGGMYDMPGTARVAPFFTTPGMSLPRGPLERVMPTYSDISIRKLQGPPLHSGRILLLTLGESIHEVMIDIHSNGFLMTFEDHLPLDRPRVVPWSPFTLLEKCQVKAVSQQWAVFKMTVFGDEGATGSTYFATSGVSAYAERDMWLETIGQVLSDLTNSLFPCYGIAVHPIPWSASTNTRIMAGYLLQAVRTGIIVIYCELHPHKSGGAHMTIYKDEYCDLAVNTVVLKENTGVFSRKGHYCNVFGIDTYHFCARSRDETDLWLRAISNVKVKLMFEAPDPTAQELTIFRNAVQEKVFDMLPVLHSPRTGPLLEQTVRAPDVNGARGDTMSPEPIDDAAEWTALPGEAAEPKGGHLGGRFLVEEYSIKSDNEAEVRASSGSTLPLADTTPHSGNVLPYRETDFDNESDDAPISAQRTDRAPGRFGLQTVTSDGSSSRAPHQREIEERPRPGTSNPSSALRADGIVSSSAAAARGDSDSEKSPGKRRADERVASAYTSEEYSEHTPYVF